MRGAGQKLSIMAQKQQERKRIWPPQQPEASSRPRTQNEAATKSTHVYVTAGDVGDSGKPVPVKDYHVGF
jgi:hypothetical protein